MVADKSKRTAKDTSQRERLAPRPGRKDEAPLRDCVREAIDEFFAHLDGHPCHGLYAMVLAEVEAPLLESVMRHTGGNQSSAAEILGMNRGTLRKKLREHGLLE